MVMQVYGQGKWIYIGKSAYKRIALRGKLLNNAFPYLQKNITDSC